MALDSPGSVHIPWYATGFRGDKLEAKLIEIAAVAPRYGATHYAVYRSRDDRYRFLQIADFNSKLEWERAKAATRDSWQRVSDTIERAVPGDSDRDGK